MYNNIKSDYFKKIVFFHLRQRKLLELIKHNKELQNLMDIKLIFYRIFSGKKRIGNKNRLGFELDYFSGQTLFKGKFLKGKRNRKGIENNKNGETIYVGGYKKGKRHGKGKEYFYNDDHSFYFEGKYLKGKRWTGLQYGNLGTERKCEIINGNGFIKEFYHYKNCPEISIECEYKNGEKNGKAKERYYLSCLLGRFEIKFEGEYLNGKKWNGIAYNNLNTDYYKLQNGKGYMIDISSECFYEGEFVNGEKNGKGKEYYEYLYKGNISYQGEYLNDKRHGKGKEYYKNKNVRFEGIYKYGFKEEGKEYYPNGKLLFKGKYKYGIKWDGEGYDENGHIIYKINNGKGFIKEYKINEDTYPINFYLVYEGEYLYGEKHGKGKEYNEKGEIIFEGEYHKDKKWNGKGKEEMIFNYFRKIIFDCEYHEGESLKGIGREYNVKGEIIFEGEYYFNKEWNGKGKEYDNKGNIIFEGEYYKGQKWKGKVIEFDRNDDEKLYLRVNI